MKRKEFDFFRIADHLTAAIFKIGIIYMSRKKAAEFIAPLNCEIGLPCESAISGKCPAAKKNRSNGITICSYNIKKKEKEKEKEETAS